MLFAKYKPGTGVISEKPLRKMIKRAVKVAEPNLREVCGLIVSHDGVLELIRTRNKAKGMLTFEISFKQIRKVKRAGRKLKHRVVGAFHSHPASGTEPGKSDLDGARGGNGMLMLIIDCTEQEAKLWRVKRHKKKREAVSVPLRQLK